MFFFILIPMFLLNFFGAYCSQRSFWKNLKKNQKNAKRIIARAENFMIVSAIWQFVGLTIWSLRNIWTLFLLEYKDCYRDRSTIDRFKILNFYIFTLAGYVFGVITLIIFPGAALYQCYRATEREKEPTKGNTVFDPHLVAQTQRKQPQTLEEFRQKVIDVLVRWRSPRGENFIQKLNCQICREEIKLNQNVEAILSHKMKGFCHVNHAHCCVNNRDIEKDVGFNKFVAESPGQTQKSADVQRQNETLMALANRGNDKTHQSLRLPSKLHLKCYCGATYNPQREELIQEQHKHLMEVFDYFPRDQEFGNSLMSPAVMRSSLKTTTHNRASHNSNKLFIR